MHISKIDNIISECVIFDLIDNPLFRRYVIICVSFPTYQAQEGAFVEDYHFACIQDFSHISPFVRCGPDRLSSPLPGCAGPV